ncbi:MAG: hypothetical protein V2J12_08890 [Gammaproteobacteria bacterium]|jgi:hypothetical protein|nr:hypothetical protein [Gammaproteobacteria bacterium]
MGQAPFGRLQPEAQNLLYASRVSAGSNGARAVRHRHGRPSTVGEISGDPLLHDTLPEFGQNDGFSE